MLDPMFSFVDPIVDPIIEPSAEELSHFIVQMEDLFETPEQFKADVAYQGSPYELYLMLQNLKAGNMNFAEFLAKANAWSSTVLDGEERQAS